MPVPGLVEWFSEEVALCKREELRLLVMELQKELNPSLDYDPAADGCNIIDEDFDIPNLDLMAAAAAAQQGRGGTPQTSQPQGALATGDGTVAATTTGNNQVAIRNNHLEVAIPQQNNQLQLVAAAAGQVQQQQKQQQVVVGTQLAVATIPGSVANQQIVAQQQAMTVAQGQQTVMVGRSVVVAAQSTQQQSQLRQIAVATGNQTVATAPVRMAVAPSNAAAPQIQIASVQSGTTEFFPDSSSNPPTQKKPSPSKNTDQNIAAISQTQQGSSTNTKTVVNKKTIANNNKQTIRSTSPAQAQQRIATANSQSSVSMASAIRQANTTQSVQNVVNSIVNTVLKQQKTKTS